MDVERSEAGSRVVLPAGMELVVPPAAGDRSGREQTSGHPGDVLPAPAGGWLESIPAPESDEVTPAPTT